MMIRTDEVVVKAGDGDWRKKLFSRGVNQAGLITHSAWSRVKIPMLEKKQQPATPEKVCECECECVDE